MAFQVDVDFKVFGPSSQNMADIEAKIERGVNPRVSVKLDIDKASLSDVSNKAKSAIGRINMPISVSIHGNGLKAAKEAADSPSFKNLQKQLKGIDEEFKNLQRSRVSTHIHAMSESMEEFGIRSAVALKRFLAFTVATAGIIKTTQLFKQSFDEAVKFEDTMVKIAQVAERPIQGVRGLRNETLKTARQFGTSANDIAQGALIIAQAGKPLSEVRHAMEAIAKANVSPTFGSAAESAEALVAVTSQFGKEVGKYEEILSRINFISAREAVESKDLVTSVQKAGGAFSIAGSNLNEFLSIITAVRATTRESAEEIATGLRTVVARISRPDTIDFFRKELKVDIAPGDKVDDVLTAIGKIRNALKETGDLPEITDVIDPKTGLLMEEMTKKTVRFARVLEELGGIRQQSKTIPLLIQAPKIDQLVNAFEEIDPTTGLKKSLQSLDKDSQTAQQSLQRDLERTKQAFLAVGDEFVSNPNSRAMIEGFLTLSRAIADTGKELVKLLPLIKLVSIPFISRVGAKFIAGGTDAIFGRTQVQTNRAHGGEIFGNQPGDSVPCMLTPGEVVLNKNQQANIGRILGKPAKQLFGEAGVPGFATGGIIDHKRPKTSYSQVKDLEPYGYPSFDDINGKSIGRDLRGRVLRKMLGRTRNYNATFDEDEPKSVPFLGDYADYSLRKKRAQYAVGFPNTLKDNSEAFNDIARHIPDDSKYLNHGQEGLAFVSPDKKVIRVDRGVVSRPQAPIMLQPDFAAQNETYSVEHLPFASGVGEWKNYTHKGKKKQGYPSDIIKAAIEDQGLKEYKIVDLHSNNAGFVGGKPIIIDPGAIKVRKTKKGPRDIDWSDYQFAKGGKIKGFATGGHIKNYSKGGVTDEDVYKELERISKMYGVPYQEIISGVFEISDEYRKGFKAEKGFVPAALFRKSERTIGYTGNKKKLGRNIEHEYLHALDFALGGEKGYLSEQEGSPFYKLALQNQAAAIKEAKRRGFTDKEIENRGTLRESFVHFMQNLPEDERVAIGRGLGRGVTKIGGLVTENLEDFIGRVPPKEIGKIIKSQEMAERLGRKNYNVSSSSIVEVAGPEIDNGLRVVQRIIDGPKTRKAPLIERIINPIVSGLFKKRSLPKIPSLSLSSIEDKLNSLADNPISDFLDRLEEKRQKGPTKQKQEPTINAQIRPTIDVTLDDMINGIKTERRRKNKSRPDLGAIGVTPGREFSPTGPIKPGLFDRVESALNSIPDSLVMQVINSSVSGGAELIGDEIKNLLPKRKRRQTEVEKILSGATGGKYAKNRPTLFRNRLSKNAISEDDIQWYLKTDEEQLRMSGGDLLEMIRKEAVKKDVTRYGAEQRVEQLKQQERLIHYIVPDRTPSSSVSSLFGGLKSKFARLKKNFPGILDSILYGSPSKGFTPSQKADLGKYKYVDVFGNFSLGSVGGKYGPEKPGLNMGGCIKKFAVGGLVGYADGTQNVKRDAFYSRLLYGNLLLRLEKKTGKSYKKVIKGLTGQPLSELIQSDKRTRARRIELDQRQKDLLEERVRDFVENKYTATAIIGTETYPGYINSDANPNFVRKNIEALKAAGVENFVNVLGRPIIKDLGPRSDIFRFSRARDKHGVEFARRYKSLKKKLENPDDELAKKVRRYNDIELLRGEKDLESRIDIMARLGVSEEKRDAYRYNILNGEERRGSKIVAMGENGFGLTKKQVEDLKKYYTPGKKSDKTEAPEDLLYGIDGSSLGYFSTQIHEKFSPGFLAKRIGLLKGLGFDTYIGVFGGGVDRLLNYATINRNHALRGDTYDKVGYLEKIGRGAGLYRKITSGKIPHSDETAYQLGKNSEKRKGVLPGKLMYLADQEDAFYNRISGKRLKEYDPYFDLPNVLLRRFLPFGFDENAMYRAKSPNRQKEGTNLAIEILKSGNYESDSDDYKYAISALKSGVGSKRAKKYLEYSLPKIIKKQNFKSTQEKLYAQWNSAGYVPTKHLSTGSGATFNPKDYENVAEFLTKFADESHRDASLYGLPYVALGRDSGPIVAYLRSQGKDVNYQLYGRLQTEPYSYGGRSILPDKKSAENWLEEVPANSYVVDTGYAGSIFNFLRGFDPHISAGALMSSSGEYKEISTGIARNSVVGDIEHMAKPTGRSYSFDNKHRAMVNHHHAPHKHRGKEDNDRHASFKDVRSETFALLKAMGLSDKEAKEGSNFVGLTRSSRLGTSESGVRDYLDMVKESRRNAQDMTVNLPDLVRTANNIKYFDMTKRSIPTVVANNMGHALRSYDEIQSVINKVTLEKSTIDNPSGYMEDRRYQLGTAISSFLNESKLLPVGSRGRMNDQGLLIAGMKHQNFYPIYNPLIGGFNQGAENLFSPHQLSHYDGVALPKKFAHGGTVPGSGTGDTVPALLSPGEVVLNKRQQSKIDEMTGSSAHLFKAAGVPGFADGGIIGKANGFLQSPAGSTAASYAAFYALPTIIQTITENMGDLGSSLLGFGTVIGGLSSALHSGTVSDYKKQLDGLNLEFEHNAKKLDAQAENLRGILDKKKGIDLERTGLEKDIATKRGVLNSVRSLNVPDEEKAGQADTINKMESDLAGLESRKKALITESMKETQKYGEIVKSQEFQAAKIGAKNAADRRAEMERNIERQETFNKRLVVTSTIVGLIGTGINKWGESQIQSAKIFERDEMRAGKTKQVIGSAVQYGAGGALAGAQIGTLAGAKFGPYGALGGLLVGAGIGAYQGSSNAGAQISAKMDEKIAEILDQSKANAGSLGPDKVGDFLKAIDAKYNLNSSETRTVSGFGYGESNNAIYSLGGLSNSAYFNEGTTNRRGNVNSDLLVQDMRRYDNTNSLLGFRGIVNSVYGIKGDVQTAPGKLLKDTSIGSEGGKYFKDDKRAGEISTFLDSESKKFINASAFEKAMGPALRELADASNIPLEMINLRYKNKIEGLEEGVGKVVAETVKAFDNMANNIDKFTSAITSNFERINRLSTIPTLLGQSVRVQAAPLQTPKSREELVGFAQDVRVGSSGFGAFGKQLGNDLVNLTSSQIEYQNLINDLKNREARKDEFVSESKSFIDRQNLSEDIKKQLVEKVRTGIDENKDFNSNFIRPSNLAEDVFKDPQSLLKPVNEQMSKITAEATNKLLELVDAMQELRAKSTELRRGFDSVNQSIDLRVLTREISQSKSLELRGQNEEARNKDITGGRSAAELGKAISDFDASIIRKQRDLNTKELTPQGRQDLINEITQEQEARAKATKGLEHLIQNTDRLTVSQQKLQEMENQRLAKRNLLETLAFGSAEDKVAARRDLRNLQSGNLSQSARRNVISRLSGLPDDFDLSAFGVQGTAKSVRERLGREGVERAGLPYSPEFINSAYSGGKEFRDEAKKAQGLIDEQRNAADVLANVFEQRVINGFQQGVDQFRAAVKEMPVPQEPQKQIGNAAGFATGGIVPGFGHSDSVPTMLTPGEMILNKAQQKKLGLDKSMFTMGGDGYHFANGGVVNYRYNNYRRQKDMEDDINSFLDSEDRALASSVRNRTYNSSGPVYGSGYTPKFRTTYKAAPKAQPVFSGYAKNKEDVNKGIPQAPVSSIPVFSGYSDEEKAAKKEANRIKAAQIIQEAKSRRQNVVPEFRGYSERPSNLIKIGKGTPTGKNGYISFGGKYAKPIVEDERPEGAEHYEELAHKKWQEKIDRRDRRGYYQQRQIKIREKEWEDEFRRKSEEKRLYEQEQARIKNRPLSERNADVIARSIIERKNSLINQYSPKDTRQRLSQGSMREIFSPAITGAWGQRLLDTTSPSELAIMTGPAFKDWVLRLNQGGIVGGVGSVDKIPAMLTPGEAVLTRNQQKAIGNELGASQVLREFEKFFKEFRPENVVVRAEKVVLDGESSIKKIEGAVAIEGRMEVAVNINAPSFNDMGEALKKDIISRINEEVVKILQKNGVPVTRPVA